MASLSGRYRMTTDLWQFQFDLQVQAMHPCHLDSAFFIHKCALIFYTAQRNDMVENKCEFKSLITVLSLLVRLNERWINANERQYLRSVMAICVKRTHTLLTFLSLSYVKIPRHNKRTSIKNYLLYGSVMDGCLLSVSPR